MSTTLTDRYPTRLLEPGPRVPRHDPVVWGDPADGPLSRGECTDFADRGYRHAPQPLFGPHEVNALRQEAARLAADPVLRADERTVVEEASQEVDRGDGRQVVELGVMELLTRQVDRVGVFRPLV
ncbi:ectoine hydroxylase, partial [Streptomyces olivaceoviridis]